MYNRLHYQTRGPHERVFLRVFHPCCEIFPVLHHQESRLRVAGGAAKRHHLRAGVLGRDLVRSSRGTTRRRRNATRNRRNRSNGNRYATAGEKKARIILHVLDSEHWRKILKGS